MIMKHLDLKWHGIIVCNMLIIKREMPNFLIKKWPIQSF